MRTVLLFSLLFALVRPDVYGAPVRLVEVSGLVETQPSGTKAWLACSSGLELSPGDKLRCSANAAAGLLYRDGTCLRVKGNTLIQLLPEGYRLRWGSSWVRVVKHGTTFRTLTPNSVVSVRGTIYSVSSVKQGKSIIKRLSRRPFYSEAFTASLPRAHLAGGQFLVAVLEAFVPCTRVTVFQGVVQVESKAGQLLCRPGRSAVVYGDRVLQGRALDINDYKTWSIGYRKYFMGSRGLPAASPVSGGNADGPTAPSMHRTRPRDEPGNMRLLDTSTDQ